MPAVTVVTRVEKRATVPPSGPVIPATGVYGFLLHDFQTTHYFRPKDASGNWGYSVPRGLLEDKDKLDNDKGWPQMVPGDPRLGVRLTENLQWFWVLQLVLSKYGIDIEPTRASFEAKLSKAQRDYIGNAWRKLTRDDTAFTNGSGTWSKQTGENTGVDFINRIGMDKPLPRLWENGCGGTVVELYARTPERQGYKAKTLKPSEFAAWRNWNFRTHRSRFVIATNSTPYLVGTREEITLVGPWRVNGMHFLDGSDVVLPLMSESGYVYFRANRVQILEPGSPWPGAYQ